MAAQYTVLLPRPMPSKRGQKYDSKRLYIILLLLLLAGDVEMNPGPRNLSQNTKDEGVRARSRRRRAAAVVPAEQCPPARSAVAAVDASGRVPPAGLEQCPPARSAAAAADAQSRLPITTNAADAWDLTHTEPEAIPGPSFTSVSLMDVMEGLRLTQLKVDKVSDELGEMKHLLHTLLRQQTQTPAVSLGSDPPVSDRRDDHAIQDDAKGNENVRSQSPGEPGLLIVGDSNVRRLRLCNTRANISFRSIPGAATDHVEREVQAPTGAVAPNVVLHVGTNDLTSKGSEQIVSNLVKLAQQAKKRSGVKQVYICSVTPRKDIGSFVYSRAESVNNRGFIPSVPS